MISSNKFTYVIPKATGHTFPEHNSVILYNGIFMRMARNTQFIQGIEPWHLLICVP